MADPIAFGDNVRVVVTPLTTEAGVAGLVGRVHGQTTPSLTGVSVLGVLTNDYAINVYFEGRGDSMWLAPELLQFVDHAPGTEISLEGVPKKWTRQPDGSWAEENLGEGSREPREKGAADASAKRRWWRLW